VVLVLVLVLVLAGACWRWCWHGPWTQARGPAAYLDTPSSVMDGHGAWVDATAPTWRAGESTSARGRCFSFLV
jgi:hypothetical protein